MRFAQKCSKTTCLTYDYMCFYILFYKFMWLFLKIKSTVREKERNLSKSQKSHRFPPATLYGQCRERHVKKIHTISLSFFPPLYSLHLHPSYSFSPSLHRMCQIFLFLVSFLSSLSVSPLRLLGEVLHTLTLLPFWLKI